MYLLHSCSCEDKFVQERSVARLWEVARFDPLLLRSQVLQMNVEAANDVDPKYQLNPRSIVSVQVCVGDVWVGDVWACIVWLRGKICVGDWCCEVVGSCEVRCSASSQPNKNMYVK